MIRIKFRAGVKLLHFLYAYSGYQDYCIFYMLWLYYIAKAAAQGEFIHLTGFAQNINETPIQVVQQVLPTVTIYTTKLWYDSLGWSDGLKL